VSKIKTISSALLLCAVFTATYAENSDAFLESKGLFVNGMQPVQLKLNNNETKTIRLMNVSLSSPVQSALATKAAFLLAHPTQKNMTLIRDMPAAKDLGMNNEPVLDQGEWGTCATFSTTGAINALYGLSGDNMVSQLCNLEVGRSLHNPNEGDGGWQGAFGNVIFDQINQFGYINKQYQHSQGCGGLKNYPAYSSNNGQEMAASDFMSNSIKTFSDKDWTPIVAYNGNFSPLSPADAQKALNNVKQAISQGYRVVFGTLIDGNVGQVGAAGTYNNAMSDAWVMTTQIQKDMQSGGVNEGHEIIIEGYDDNACATYSDNGASKTQCGLLKIRNSWSSWAGDQGDYYMSYDYFKGMMIESYAVGADVKDQFKPIA